MKAWRLFNLEMIPCDEAAADYVITARWADGQEVREVWNWSNIGGAVLRLLQKGSTMPRVTVESITPELLAGALDRVLGKETR